MYDPYFLSRGAKSLFTLFGAEHSLGGIVGYEVQEATDENPERVALIQRVLRTPVGRSPGRLWRRALTRWGASNVMWRGPIRSGNPSLPAPTR